MAHLCGPEHAHHAEGVPHRSPVDDGTDGARHAAGQDARCAVTQCCMQCCKKSNGVTLLRHRDDDALEAQSLQVASSLVDQKVIHHLWMCELMRLCRRFAAPPPRAKWRSYYQPPWGTVTSARADLAATYTVRSACDDRGSQRYRSAGHIVGIMPSLACAASSGPSGAFVKPPTLLGVAGCHLHIS